MKIVALELMTIGEDIDISKFDSFGEFVKYDLTSKEQIEERAADADVIIINKLPINETTISGLNNLKMVMLTATGTDNVDKEYCASRGIQVRNVKGYSTTIVVQHTFAALFYVLEKLNYYDNYVKSGEYVKSPIFCNLDEKFFELKDKTWGIVGLGDIGRGVADVAKAFGCKVVYYSTSGKNANPNYDRVDLDELLSQSDIISIHAPLTDATRNLFNKDTFKKMKNTAYLVNMGRGPIINDADLAEALNNGEIAGAALDVLSKEPMEESNPLLSIQDSRRLIITPHIAWASYEARQRLMDMVAENLQSYIDGGDLNLVTPR